jgi:putative hemolysin
MRASTTFVAPPLAAFALSAAVLLAPNAAAQPQCGSTSPQTTHCTTSGGGVQIVTSPPAVGSPTWPGFTYRYWDYPNYIVDFG